jgi:hypothetical protein
VNENKPADDAHAQRRRRVLRGALSAPVVLTISNGAGAQMTSNRRCVNSQVQNPTTLPRTYSSGVSVPATVIRVRLWRSGTNLFVRGTDIKFWEHSSRLVSWISSGQFRKFNPVSQRLEGGNLSPTLISPAPVATSPAQWAVLQMDQLGNIVTVGLNNGVTTSMIAGTCWASFRMGPP